MMGKSSFSAWSKVVLVVLLATCWAADAEDLQEAHPQFCKTQGCSAIGSELHHSRNRTIHECEDFYEHACDGWIKTIHPVEPQSKISLTPNYVLTEVVRDQVYELLKEIKPDDIEAVVKAKKFFAACNDLVSIRNKDLGPIVQLLIGGGEWPLSVTPNRWNTLNFGWKSIHESIADEQAISALFNIDVEIDRKDSEEHILSFSVPTVPSRRGKRDQAYRQYVREVAELFKKLRSPNSFIDPSEFTKDIVDLITFEGKLEKLTRTPQQTDEIDGVEYRITTVHGLQQEWDEIVNALPHSQAHYLVKWSDVISERFLHRGVWIEETERIALRPGNVVQELAKLLTQTPLRTIFNYIQWKMIHTLLPLTSHGLEDTDQWDLDNAAPTRRDYCVVKHPMPHAINYLYSNEYLNSTTKAVARDMVNRIRDELKLEVSETSWIDDAAKTAIKDKLDSMKIIIGNPRWFNAAKLNGYYEGYTVGEDYLDNVVAYRKFDVNKRHTRLHRPVFNEEIPFEFFKSRKTYTSYDYQTNALTIGAPNFQAPFYVESRPTALNFAGLGTVIAHEMAHSIDTVGRLYDQHGNKQRWWEDSTIATYKNKARCFAQQYRGYTLDKNPTQTRTIKVKGELTHAENIADAVGVRAALRAFRKMKTEGKTTGSTVRFLDHYTSDELFFYGYANNMCESISRSALPFFYKNSKNTPYRWRVNGALSNIKEFAESLQCEPMSPMNPATRCLLWD